VIHYSAATSNKKAVLKYENKNTNYGYHFMVDRDGSFYESAPTDKKTQHIGSQSGVINSNSVGLCIMNTGFERKGVKAQSDWVLGEFPNSPDAEAIQYANNNGKWEPYTNASLATAARLCAQVLKDNNLTVNRIVGHSDIQSDKSDPGPAFDMNGFRRMVKANMSV
jgi:N-acetyl-anhydromuramyl-L-alanine amidase AmpD